MFITSLSKRAFQACLAGLLPWRWSGRRTQKAAGEAGCRGQRRSGGSRGGARRVVARSSGMGRHAYGNPSGRADELVLRLVSHGRRADTLRLGVDLKAL